MTYVIDFPINNFFILYLFLLFLAHLASVEAEVDSKLKRQGAIRRKDLENNFSENRPAGVFLSSENASFGAENPQNVNMEDEEANFNSNNVVEPLKIKEIDLDDFKMDISDVDLNLSPEKKEISGLEIISNQSISIPPPPTRVNSNLKLSLSNGSRNSINDSTETYIIETDTIDVNLSLSPEKKENQGECFASASTFLCPTSKSWTSSVRFASVGSS